MKKIKLKLLVFAIIGFYIVGCNVSETTISDTSANLSSFTSEIVTSIPYASDETLSKFDGDSEVLNYKVVRTLGTIALDQNIKDDYGWYSTKLSERPVIIYSNDSKPIYYEFVVIGERGEEIGTVTTYARKNKASVIKNVFPYVRMYEGLITKGEEYKVFSDSYPRSIYYGIPSKSGDEPSIIVDSVTDEIVDFINIEDSELDLFNSLTDEELAEMGILDREEHLINYENEKKLEDDESEMLWSFIESLPFEIEDEFSDENIVEFQEISKGTTTLKSSFHTIPSYNTYKMRSTIWSGYCGPSAICWVYRGLYDSYDGVYLPLNGDTGFDKISLIEGDYEYVRYTQKYTYNFFGLTRNSYIAKYYSNVLLTSSKFLDKPGTGTNIAASEEASAQADNSLWYDAAQASGTLDNNGAFGGTPTWPQGFAPGIENITDDNYTAEFISYRDDVVIAIKNDDPVIAWDAPDHWVVYYGVDQKTTLKTWIRWVQDNWYSGHLDIGSSITEKYKYKLHDNSHVTGSSSSYWADKAGSIFNINYKIVTK